MGKEARIGGIDINDVFPHQVCLNLNRRPERWQQSQLEFARHQVKLVRRYPALDGKVLTIPSHWNYTPGAYGCLLSHLEIVREARVRNLSSILIFEDDVALATDFQEKFARYIGQVPSDWDMLFFGAFHDALPIPVSENVCRISRADSTFAYVLNHTIFDNFIASNSAATIPVDWNNRQLQTEFNCYCFMPHLAWVKPVYSDAQERFANHWYLRESLFLPGSGPIPFVADSVLVMSYFNPSRNNCVAEHLLRMVSIYSKRLRDLTLIIVEQGTESTIDQEALPHNCSYRFMRSDSPFNRARCFNRGVQEFIPSKDVFVFMDGNIYLESRDIAGNIAMAHKYDLTTGFERVFQLSDHDVAKLLHDDQRAYKWFDPESCPVERKVDDYRGCCFFNRRAFQSSGGWLEEDPEKLNLSRYPTGEESLNRFNSPNHAFRISPEV
jgi:GR25 family glycosyltransferase involved in LPS biosynthesis